MPEDQNINSKTDLPQYTLRIKGSLVQAFLRFINGILTFLSLRKSKQFWGMVYDSVTKQPLDPVIVKMLYADGGEVETCVTDLNGCYGFLARPGKFKIFARRTNYTFPSKFVAGEKDGIFENLYHGEFFSLYNDSEVLAPNIPMDPVGSDWNQTAKRTIQKNYAHTEVLIHRLAAVFFWFFLIFCLIGSWEFFPNLPWYLYAFFAAYALIFFLRFVIPEPRLWGKIILSRGINQSPDLSLQLESPKIPGIVFGKAVIHENGKFLLRASPGKYLLKMYTMGKNQEKLPIASIPIKIGPLGVFNSTLIVS